MSQAKEKTILDDLTIVALFFERSELAIAALADKYGGRMTAISRNILQNEQDVEECVNDAYLGVWNTVPPTRPDPLGAYACRIARNVSLTRYRYNRASRRAGGETLDPDELSEILPSTDTVEAEVERGEITRALEAFLDGQSEVNRYIFLRRYWFFDPPAQIASQLRMSNAGVYLRLDRMKKTLRKQLNERGILL